jgi:hypothetical protein
VAAAHHGQPGAGVGHRPVRVSADQLALWQASQRPAQQQLQVIRSREPEPEHPAGSARRRIRGFKLSGKPVRAAPLGWAAALGRDGRSPVPVSADRFVDRRMQRKDVDQAGDPEDPQDPVCVDHDPQ